MPLDTLAAVAGSTGGALLIYLAPALMALKLREAEGETPDSGADGAAAARGVAGIASTVGLWGLAGVGVALAIVGTVDSVTRLV